MSRQGDLRGVHACGRAREAWEIRGFAQPPDLGRGFLNHDPYFFFPYPPDRKKNTDQSLGHRGLGWAVGRHTVEPFSRGLQANKRKKLFGGFLATWDKHGVRDDRTVISGSQTQTQIRIRRKGT
jgi:hypothetical protein